MSGNTSAEATADDRDWFEQCKNDHATELLDPAQQLNRPRLLVVIEKKRLMCQPANQVVASAILYKPRLPHVEQCITKPITISAILCQ